MNKALNNMHGMMVMCIITMKDCCKTYNQPTIIHT